MNHTKLFAAWLVLGAARTAAGGDPVEIRWNELATQIVGREIAIPLEGGVTVAGQALAVGDQSLLLDIRKSSDPRRYARGETSLPRAAIAEVRVLEKRGKGGRVVGAVLGTLVGFVGGMEIAEASTRSSSNAAALSVFIAIWGGSAVGGYYAGRSTDRHWKRLRIAPAEPGQR
jgi:hypothetical protein